MQFLKIRYAIVTIILDFITAHHSTLATAPPASPGQIKNNNSLEQILAEIGSPGVSLKELLKDEIQVGRLIQTLIDKKKTVQRTERLLFQQEKDLRLYVQSLLDIVKVIEKFFVRCWPPWAKARNLNDHSKPAWRILLTNNEDVLVRNLKQKMKRHSCDESTFIDIVAEYEVVRNAETYPLLTRESRHEALEFLKSKSTEIQRTVLEILVVNFDYLTYEALLPKDLPAEHLDERELEKSRENFTLIRFNKLPLVCDDEQMRHSFQKIVNNFKTPSGKEIGWLGYIPAQSTDVPAYALMDSFQSAYAAWTRREELFAISQNDFESMDIIDINEHPWATSGYIEITLEDKKSPPSRPDDIARLTTISYSLNSLDPVKDVVEKLPDLELHYFQLRRSKSNSKPRKLLLHYSNFKNLMIDREKLLKVLSTERFGLAISGSKKKKEMNDMELIIQPTTTLK